jgi:hypothetical protein
MIGSLAMLKEGDLHQYYDANKLLVDCLNSDCYISHLQCEGREIEAATLLLPVTQIKRRG